MATKSSQEATSTEQVEELLDAVDSTLDRLKTLYEQYFLGIQKQAPAFIHSDVERKLRDLTQLNIRNTGLRYRLATLQQKFGSYNSYWRRTLRQIENGTYARNLAKIGREAARTGSDIPEEILAAMPKRMREQVLRDRDAAIAIAKRRHQVDHAAAEDELLTLADEAPTPPPAEKKTRGGAHVIDEADADIDYNEMFAAFEDDAPKEIGGTRAHRTTVRPQSRPQPPRMPLPSEAQQTTVLPKSSVSVPPAGQTTALPRIEPPAGVPATARSTPGGIPQPVGREGSAPGAVPRAVGQQPSAPIGAPRPTPSSGIPAPAGQQSSAPVPRALGHQPSAPIPRTVGQQPSAPIGDPRPTPSSGIPAAVGQHPSAPIPRAVGQQPSTPIPRSVGQQPSAPIGDPRPTPSSGIPAPVGQHPSAPVPRAVGQQPSSPTSAIPRPVGQQPSTPTSAIPTTAIPRPTPPAGIPRPVGQQPSGPTAAIPRPAVGQPPSGAVPRPAVNPPSGGIPRQAGNYGSGPVPQPTQQPGSGAVQAGARPQTPAAGTPRPTPAGVPPPPARTGAVPVITQPIPKPPGDVQRKTQPGIPPVPAITQAIPRLAPSQQSRPIPVMPGSAQQTGPVPVESMPGPFPRTPVEAKTTQLPRTPAAQPQPQRTQPIDKPAPTQAMPRAPLRPPPGMTEADVNALHAKYVKAKEMIGEKVDAGSREKLLKTINQTAPKIMEQYQAKAVDFSVVVKDNQVIIKAKPKT